MQQVNEALINLKSFFDSVPMAMGIVELTENDIIHISDNKLSAEIFGIELSELAGKRSSELGSSQEVIKKWITHYHEAQKNNSPVTFNYWHESKFGRKHFTATVSFVEMGKERPRFSYVLQDTTHDIEIKNQYKNQEKFLETVLDNIPDMIFVKDAKDLRFLKFNKAGEDLIGYSKNDLIGKNDYDLFPEEQAKFFTSKDKSVFFEKKMIEIPEEPIETRFKGKRFLHTKKIPLYDSEGHPQYLVGISEDITEKLQATEAKQKMYQEQYARQEIEKSLQDRDEFISIASHELKSPLSALKLQAQMFRRFLDKNDNGILSKEKVNQLIDLTEKEVNRLDRLVNDMLDVSRIRTGNLSMQISEFNLNGLIHDVLTRMKPQFLLSECGEPEFIFTNVHMIGRWDYYRIEQVILNLLTNAIRYGKGSPITINLAQVENNALISVHDRGRGIAPEDIHKIFNRFERAVGRNEVSGLGLGLFISKQIVEAHSGKIWVESVLHEGSTFFVKLPLS